MSSASGALVGRMTSGGSGVTFTSDEDDEDFNLVLPEIDEEFLDDAYFTNDMRRDGIDYQVQAYQLSYNLGFF